MKYRFRTADEQACFFRNCLAVLPEPLDENGLLLALTLAARCDAEALIDPQSRYPVFPCYADAYRSEDLCRHAEAVLRPLLQVLGLDSDPQTSEYLDLERAYMAALAESVMPDEVLEVRQNGFLPGFGLAGELVDWHAFLTTLSLGDLGCGLIVPIQVHEEETPQPFPLKEPEPEFARDSAKWVHFVEFQGRALLDYQHAAGCSLAVPCIQETDNSLLFTHDVAQASGLFLAVQLGPRVTEAYAAFDDDGRLGELHYLQDEEVPTFDFLSPYSGVPPMDLTQSDTELPERILFQSPEVVLRFAQAAQSALSVGGAKPALALLRNACARGLGYTDFKDLRARHATGEGESYEAMDLFARFELLKRLSSALLVAYTQQAGDLPAGQDMGLLDALADVLGLLDARGVLRINPTAPPPTAAPASARLH